MSPQLPASIHVLERGWLSANNILLFEGENATVIDSGYVTHAAQTVDLVSHALDGRNLKRLLNTHSHSDHIGGNAALQAAFDCEIIVPAGLHAARERLLQTHAELWTASDRRAFGALLQQRIQDERQRADSGEGGKGV